MMHVLCSYRLKPICFLKKNVILSKARTLIHKFKITQHKVLTGFFFFKKCISPTFTIFCCICCLSKADSRPFFDVVLSSLLLSSFLTPPSNCSLENLFLLFYSPLLLVVWPNNVNFLVFTISRSF